MPPNSTCIGHTARRNPTCVAGTDRGQLYSGCTIYNNSSLYPSGYSLLITGHDMVLSWAEATVAAAPYLQAVRAMAGVTFGSSCASS